ncbi:rod shape-determining protein RodA [Halalkalibacillus sediminis]|uniref:Rod shape-determining protein RodA n=1 Tax=Halalkalibacillus sediminis TaxID=2018042 RepID=A0A2I0QVI3_9BACI|nr:FtsW/RodA/SpoVE family cell cycle protein [Halalkalibacillus sediminis]PKR78357.1 rod shape-determining protein RodA [Halalkalibacillus sediminis]
MNNDNIQKPKLDSFLITVMTALVFIGCFTLYTLDGYLPSNLQGSMFYLKQGVWFLIGIVAIFMLMILDFDKYRKMAWPLYILGIGMLVGLFFLPWSLELNGALSWYVIAGQTVQPSEFMKLFLVILLAHVITSHNEKWTTKSLKYDLFLLGKIVLLTLPPLCLIFIQPDLGSALVIAAIAGFLILISGIRWRVLAIIAGITLLVGIALTYIYTAYNDQIVTLLEEQGFGHFVQRIEAWQNPHLYQDGSSMQVIKSMLAIGSGQLFGKGMMSFDVYVPERHSDMIFTAIAEQFGFIGSSVVIALYFLLIYRIIQIALECKDPFGTYLSIGVVGMLSYQIFQNIGMSIQLLPLTGLPLPFLSQGGTSLLVYMAAIGLILNVRSRQKQYMFEQEDD